jgi:hypothetical protein
VAFTVKGFKRYGIERGDKATIAMTGEVLPGELGYFSIRHYGQAYKQFRFLTEQDEDCRNFAPSTCSPGGVCLRYRPTGCAGTHDGLAYGRVCAVGRDGRPVETTFSLRPYDEREGPATTRLDTDAEPPPKADDAAERLCAVPQAIEAHVAGRKTIEEVAEAEASRATLLGNLAAWGLGHVSRAWLDHPFSVLGVTSESLAAYSIRKGDKMHITLDGDAEHGELAFVTYYDLDEKERYYYPAFLAVEGEHFCLRENPLECDNHHHDADCMTIVGRVYHVERGGLPVKLKGLELRGLPFAEDLPPVVDKD